jgi:hypothetical protein
MCANGTGTYSSRHLRLVPLSVSRQCLFKRVGLSLMFPDANKGDAHFDGAFLAPLAVWRGQMRPGVGSSAHDGSYATRGRFRFTSTSVCHAQQHACEYFPYVHSI